jgi:hypothetical protein
MAGQSFYHDGIQHQNDSEHRSAHRRRHLATPGNRIVGYCREFPDSWMTGFLGDLPATAGLG